MELIDNRLNMAIELLEKCFNSMSLQNSNMQEELELMDEITDFLNNIEDENIQRS